MSKKNKVDKAESEDRKVVTTAHKLRLAFDLERQVNEYLRNVSRVNNGNPNFYPATLDAVYKAAYNEVNRVVRDAMGVPEPEPDAS